MKTLFRLGLPAERGFWMGVSSINPGTLDYAMGTYAQVQGWFAQTLNVSDILGSDADQFQSVNTEIRGLYDDIVAISQKTHANQDLTDNEVMKANKFINDADLLWNIIQAHPVTPPAGATPAPSTAASAPTTNPAQAITSAAGQVAKALTTPASTAAAPAPVTPSPAAGPDLAPLLIGGGAVAAVVLVIVMSR